MFKSLIRRKLDQEERRFGGSMDYVRHMLDVSFGAFWRFVTFLPLSNYRKVLPADACHVARLVALQDADCGPCVQMEVNAAKLDGIPSETIRATLDGNFDELPQELIDVHRFTKSVVMATEEGDDIRETLRTRYGEAGLVELALAIASCRVFPTAKRAMGYAQSCSLVNVDLEHPGTKP
jgi:alkylhydroperoxidase family enzyme